MGVGDDVNIVQPFGPASRLAHHFHTQERPTKLPNLTARFFYFGNFCTSAEWLPTLKGGYFDIAFGALGEVKNADTVLIHLGALDYEYTSLLCPCLHSLSLPSPLPRSLLSFIDLCSCRLWIIEVSARLGELTPRETLENMKSICLELRNRGLVRFLKRSL